METYKLYKPVTFVDEEITELQFNFDDLSAVDLENAEREARKMLQKKETMVVPETHKLYQAHVAAKACGYPVRLIRSLGARDYVQVCLHVQNFLFGGDSEDEEENQVEKQEYGNP